MRAAGSENEVHFVCKGDFTRLSKILYLVYVVENTSSAHHVIEKSEDDSWVHQTKTLQDVSFPLLYVKGGEALLRAALYREKIPYIPFIPDDQHV